MLLFDEVTHVIATDTMQQDRQSFQMYLNIGKCLNWPHVNMFFPKRHQKYILAYQQKVYRFVSRVPYWVAIGYDFNDTKLKNWKFVE